MVVRVEPLVRRVLQRHPQTPCDSVHEIAVDVGTELPETIVLRFRIVGDIEALRVPDPGTRLDPERLWKHTCCELFAASPGDADYVEWNFSPTGQSARFAFSSYRCRIPTSAPDTSAVSVAKQPGELRLEARTTLPLALAGSLCISLTTVIEDAAGRLSYWALHHPSGRPDFHHRDGFTLTLAASLGEPMRG